MREMKANELSGAFRPHTSQQQQRRHQRPSDAIVVKKDDKPEHIERAQKNYRECRGQSFGLFWSLSDITDVFFQASTTKTTSNDLLLKHERE